MKKSSNKGRNSLLDKLKELWQIKFVRTTLFFGFYFFFFLFLFLNLDIDSLDNGNNNSSNNQNSENQVGNQDNSQNGNQSNNQNNTTQNNNSNTTTWEFNTLINNNYSYTYTINENGNNLLFEGRVSEPNELINEYQYNYFLNLYNINQITKNSKYLERITLQEGYQFNYEISNKILGELLETNNVLANDKLNKIIIYTDSNMVIKRVELELTNLMQELDNYNNYKIVLGYENK